MNITGGDLLGEVSERMRLMDAANKEAEKYGIQLAQAERDYRVEKAKAILTERDKGTPATIIADVVKGKPNIADMCLKRDIQAVMYKSSESANQNYKLQARLLEAQISREWGGGTQ